MSNGDIRKDELEASGNHAGAIIGFATTKGKQVHARVASSFISLEQAELNLKELGGNSFDALKQKGRNRWNEVLGRIDVSTDNVDDMRTFYSCLYRCTLFPRMFFERDANGKIVHYSPYNGQVEPGYMYTDMGFWDIFRALMPLVDLVYPDVARQMQEGFYNAYKESGFYPEWATPGHRECMVGNNSASIVADAYMKGLLPKQSLQAIYEALLHDANNVHPKVSTTGRVIDKLDAVFTTPPTFGGNVDTRKQLIHEMREMQVVNMGQYAHGNQPIQHMIYLYNYAGEPWKAQYWAREVMRRLYLPTPDGYCGDEDNGLTSAWYVMSALGFYSVCPGSKQYVLGSPLFKKASIHLPNGKAISMTAKDNDDANRYVQSLKVNGKGYDKNYLTHELLSNGATLSFQMSDRPNKKRGTQRSSFP